MRFRHNILIRQFRPDRDIVRQNFTFLGASKMQRRYDLMGQEFLLLNPWQRYRIFVKPSEPTSALYAERKPANAQKSL